MSREAIGDKLIASGILPNLKGFAYIVDAVLDYGPSAPAGMIYTGVAKRNGTTAARVERGIRHAKGKSEIYKNHTNNEFIALLRWELRKEGLEL